MKANPTLSRAPDFAARLGVILAGLAALVACRLLRDPFRAALVVPLWTHLTRAARRLTRAFACLAAGLSPRPRVARPRASRPHLKPALPTRRGWLVVALGAEAAAYASQIESLLAEPAAADALANSLAARRTLAPICRMLGLAAPRPRRPRVRVRVRPQPPPAPAAAPRPIPPAWMREDELPPAAHLWWLPPRRLRSG
jgi:hypothetical protein